MSEVAGLNKEGSKRLLAPFFKALVGALGGSHTRVHGVFSLPLLLLLLPKASIHPGSGVLGSEPGWLQEIDQTNTSRNQVQIKGMFEVILERMAMSG